MHEWTLYLYDFLPMILTLGLCLSWYDPNIKPNARKDMELGLRR
jgi:hypothetical protein